MDEGVLLALASPYQTRTSLQFLNRSLGKEINISPDYALCWEYNILRKTGSILRSEATGYVRCTRKTLGSQK